MYISVRIIDDISTTKVVALLLENPTRFFLTSNCCEDKIKSARQELIATLDSARPNQSTLKF